MFGALGEVFCDMRNKNDTIANVFSLHRITYLFVL